MPAQPIDFWNTTLQYPPGGLVVLTRRVFLGRTVCALYFCEDRKVTSMGTGAFPIKGTPRCQLLGLVLKPVTSSTQLSQTPVLKLGPSSNGWQLLEWIVHCVPSSGHRRINNSVFIGESNTRPFSINSREGVHGILMYVVWLIENRGSSRALTRASARQQCCRN